MKKTKNKKPRCSEETEWNCFEPVCDQLRTSPEPASVMEFGFNNPKLYLKIYTHKMKSIPGYTAAI